MLEVVRREAPHIHRYRRILFEELLLTVLVREGDLTIRATSDRGALDDTREEALVIYFADTACYCTAFAERIAYAVADHAVLVVAVGEAAELVCQSCEAVTAIEVVSVDHGEGLVDHLCCHHDGVVRTPRLLAALGYSEAFGELVQILEDDLNRDLVLVLRDDLLTELLLEGAADDEDDLAEASADGIEDRVVHDGFP